MSSPDPEINRNVRQVLTRNWFDLTKTNFASRRGIVRMIGELKKLGREVESRIEPSHLEALDTELRRLKGVQRVHYDLVNWRRNSDGEWVPVDEERREITDRGAGADVGHGEFHRA